ncbi:DUF4174 domain-containing protein [Primorskyibacter sp. S187A]|uniref:DUF4174 domain-containing protein n=1 Tax=Primorskyibacter sp. S187A TaxID=3415130 RepID=UPI003C7A3482
MRWILAMAMCFGMGASAEEAQDVDLAELIQPSGEHQLDEYLWVKRPIVVFSDSPADPRYVRQMQFLTERLDELAERDVVVLTDTDPTVLSPLREKLRPRGFMMVLIGKDGGIKLRKPLPFDVREISRTIDKMPMRQQEVRDRRAEREGS